MTNPQKKFAKIYDQYINKIYRFIFLKVNSQEIAQDITSETFLRCWNAFKDKGPEIKNITGFLYQTAKNLIIDHYRQKARTRISPLENIQLIDQKNDLERQIVFASDMEGVKQALAGLKDNYQNVIIWHYIDNFSIREIGQLMGRTEGNVRVLLHRGLNELKKNIAARLRRAVKPRT